MRKPLLLIIISLIISCSLLGQTTQLTFTGINNMDWTQLDSIRIINRTLGGDTVLVWPDTLASFGGTVGINQYSNSLNQFRVFQNYPNPIKLNSTLTIYIPENGEVSMVVMDIMGRQQLKTSKMLDEGFHSFALTPGSEDMYFITVQFMNQRNSIRLTSLANSTHSKFGIVYIGKTNEYARFKSAKSISLFEYIPGNELLYVGYSGGVQSGILHIPEIEESYTFQFASNIPCPDVPTLEYGGQLYNTVQIMSQCWLKENLNIGTMILNTEVPANNSVIEKYCLENEVDSCTLYGGYYRWEELIQYNAQNHQGICPDGWHVATDEDWKILEGAVDSQYGIGTNEWDDNNNRGFDAGLHIKSAYFWHNGGNGIDQYGFNILPTGYKNAGESFYNQYRETYFWTSTESNNDNAWHRYFGYSSNRIKRADNYEKERGFNVRCIKD